MFVLTTGAVLGLAPTGAGRAHAETQGAPVETVAWTVSAPTAGALKPGSRLAITVHGAVLQGWHVYALTQPLDGPTPLRVAVDANQVVTADGEPSGSEPLKVHDSAFDQDTQFYAHDFTVTVPVRLASRLAAGVHRIPLSVRFQTCDGQICKPPKSVSLTAAIAVQAEG